MNPYTIDFETTGKDAKTAFPIEVALAAPDDGAYRWESFIALPEGEKIPPETSAVHHIIDSDLEGAPQWSQVLSRLWLEVSLGGELEPHQVLLIAHNAEYEQTVLANTMLLDCQWVCTFRCALVAFPDAPSHSNEALRYWLGFGTGRAAAQASHSALHDCKVTGGIFNALYGWFSAELARAGKIGADLHPLDLEVQKAVVAEMVRISKEMPKLPTCPIGKDRGKKWADLDTGLLHWFTKQADMRADVVHCAKEELARRSAR